MCVLQECDGDQPEVHYEVRNDIRLHQPRPTPGQTGAVQAKHHGSQAQVAQDNLQPP